jgi:hypothetical protein
MRKVIPSEARTEDFVSIRDFQIHPDRPQHDIVRSIRGMAAEMSRSAFIIGSACPPG